MVKLLNLISIFLSHNVGLLVSEPEILKLWDTDEVGEVEEAAPDFRADISSLLRSELLRTARRNHSVYFYDE